MGSKSRNLVDAIDRLTDVVSACCCGNIEFPQIANGPVETVLAFNTNESLKLILDDGPVPYFSSTGVLTDLCNKVVPGSRVETCFPADDQAVLDGLFTLPNPQPAPFTKPPVDPTNVKDVGFSKQAYFFADGSSIVTVSPSLPKISYLKGGGAQFWVGSIGVISQATGKYEGANGVTCYVGSAYFKKFPKKDNFPAILQLLAKGFKVESSTYVKLVFKKDLA